MKKVRKIVPDSTISSYLGEREQKNRRNSQDYRSEFARAREKLTCGMRMRVRMIAVSCRRPFGVRPLLLLLAGIRSEIVPPSQYTHHNRLLYPRLRFKPLQNTYPFNSALGEP